VARSAWRVLHHWFHVMSRRPKTMMGLFNIGCSGLRCILKAWANSPHITEASCLQVWKSLRIREGGGFPRAIHICSSESSNWKGCVSIRRVRTWNLLKNLGPWSTARDAGHWLIMRLSSPSVDPAAGRHSGHSLSW